MIVKNDDIIDGNNAYCGMCKTLKIFDGLPKMCKCEAERRGIKWVDDKVLLNNEDAIDEPYKILGFDLSTTNDWTAIGDLIIKPNRDDEISGEEDGC